MTVPRDGSAADKVAGNRHKDTNAKEKVERMELLEQKWICKRQEAGATDEIDFKIGQALFYQQAK